MLKLWKIKFLIGLNLQNLFNNIKN